MKVSRLLLGVVLAFWSGSLLAVCIVNQQPGQGTKPERDWIARTFANLSDCPSTLEEFVDIIKDDSLITTATMVANRGYHNPRFGSFSLFESVSGFSQSLDVELKPEHFMFGHFTGAAQGVVRLDQAPRRGKLLIELILWDFKKELYNFYELIGNGRGADWFYRGDSEDAFRDNAELHLSANPAFGKRMRCSGCHTTGGPIMKELQGPHNDWWTSERPLVFSPNVLSEKVANKVEDLADAKHLAKAVENGINLLESSEPFQKFKETLSLPEQLRPLFCLTEINLISDSNPIDQVAASTISSEYFINPLLYPKTSISFSKTLYKELSADLWVFPETNRSNPDHAWLAPVKSYADQKSIETLVNKGMFDEEFVLDVLAIDFQNPAHSKIRCDLLQMVPLAPDSNWQQKFVANLTVSQNEGAIQLLSHLQDPNKDSDFHKMQAGKHLEKVRVDMNSQDLLIQYMQKLQSDRNAVFESVISKNPLGQILEPGFRVVFPVSR